MLNTIYDILEIIIGTITIFWRNDKYKHLSFLFY